MKKTQAKKHSKGLFLLVPFLKTYKLKLFLVILALIVTSFSVLGIGKLLQYLIDFAFDNDGSYYLNLSLLAFLSFVIILAIAGYFRSNLVNEIGERIVASLRQKAYRNVILSSNDFFENSKIGDIISRLTVDTTLLYNIISNVVSFLLRNILLFFGGLVFLFLTNAKLTLIALLLIPLIILPIIILGKKVKKFSLKAQEKVGNLSSYIEESMNAIKTIKSYQNEEKEAQNFDNLSILALNSSLAKIKFRSLLISITIFAAFAFVGFILWLGSGEVISDKMSKGELSSFVFYAVITATALVSISQVMSQLQTASAATIRIFDLINIKPSIKQLKNPVKLPKDVLSGKNLSLEFKNVNFAYPKRKQTLILDNFNLKIKKKEKLALIGSSGSGKSTVFELLLRFFDVDCGQILINNKFDIKKLDLSELRSLFSYISQDSFLFSGTVFENITYGTKDAKRSNILDLINKNKAFDFINKLPKGIDSFIGQKGVMLSGGQRQRIAILRAIINDAPILLLDEATNSLDKKNEELINELIDSLIKDKIVILITHQLSNIKKIDNIVKMG